MMGAFVGGEMGAAVMGEGVGGDIGASVSGTTDAFVGGETGAAVKLVSCCKYLLQNCSASFVDVLDSLLVDCHTSFETALTQKGITVTDAKITFIFFILLLNDNDSNFVLVWFII
jgi:hypothetical protein